jgi:hypothetical protein
VHHHFTTNELDAAAADVRNSSGSGIEAKRASRRRSAKAATERGNGACSCSESATRPSVCHVYVLLVEVDAVVVLATSVTATTGMLAVLAYKQTQPTTNEQHAIPHQQEANEEEAAAIGGEGDATAAVAGHSSSGGVRVDCSGAAAAARTQKRAAGSAPCTAFRAAITAGAHRCSAFAASCCCHCIR